MVFSPDALFSFFSLYASLLASLWSVLAVAALVFAGYSAILLYHWFRYAYASPLTYLFLIVYFGASSALFGVLLITAALA